MGISSMGVDSVFSAAHCKSYRKASLEKKKKRQFYLFSLYYLCCHKGFLATLFRGQCGLFTSDRCTGPCLVEAAGEKGPIFLAVAFLLLGRLRGFLLLVLFSKQQLHHTLTTLSFLSFLSCVWRIGNSGIFAQWLENSLSESW